jgi:imidazole glycerol-phosphate synthase subunit HisH
MKIGILDIGVGNIGSIKNMLTKIGVSYEILRETKSFNCVSKLILPGVGSFDSGMKKLCNSHFFDKLNDVVLNQNMPILGICLGMQLMTRGSEEGDLEGLGWIDADVVRFSPKKEENLKVPHMGWNYVRNCKVSGIIDTSREKQKFYFVHSYHVVCDDYNDVLLETDYGSVVFHSAFIHKNFIGCQFHPEKSHRYGMNLLKAFAANFED